MEKPRSAKSKSSSPGSQRRNLSPKSRASTGKKKSTPSPSRKSPRDELKSALRKGSGDKKKKKTVVKSPDLTEDGMKIVDMSGQGMTIVPLNVINGLYQITLNLTSCADPEGGGRGSRPPPPPPPPPPGKITKI